MSDGDAAFVISVGGISNTIGILDGGVVSERSQPSPLILIVVSLTVALVPSFVLPFCYQFFTLNP